MARGIQVGDKAPDFTLPNQSGEEVSLHDRLAQSVACPDRHGDQARAGQGLRAVQPGMLQHGRRGGLFVDAHSQGHRAAARSRRRFGNRLSPSTRPRPAPRHLETGGAKKCGRQITKPIGKCRPPLNSGLSPGFSYAEAIVEANRTELLSDMIFMFIVFHLHLAFCLGDGMTDTLRF